MSRVIANEDDMDDFLETNWTKNEGKMSDNENVIAMNMPSGEEGRFKNNQGKKDSHKEFDSQRVDPKTAPLNGEMVGRVVIVTKSGVRQVMHTFNQDHLLPVNGTWSLSGEVPESQDRRNDIAYYYWI